jgi:hypothetical protein
MYEAMALAESGRRAALADVHTASDDDLCAAAIALEQARASLDAAEAHVLAELDVRGVCDREFGLVTASWLADRTHASRPHVAARVQVGKKLRTLTEVDAALAAGQITFEHARALADATNPRIADDLAACQDQLIDLAGRAPFMNWRRQLSVLVDLLDQDGGYDPDRDLARNHLHVHRVTGDQAMLSGELVGEAALVFTQAVEAEADVLFRQFRSDHDQDAIATIPRRSTLLALALVSLCRKAQATDDATSHAPGVDITLALDARHDSTSTDPGQPGAEPATESRTPAPRLTTIDGDPLELAHYAHLFCDANFVALLMSSLGLPLDLGRSVRLATPAQRRALAVRDGGCVFPGCDAPPSWCDAHHVRPYEQLGPTDLPNLALLCRRHHGVTHRHGWQMRAGPDQTFTWVTPTGLTLTSQRQRGRPPDVGLSYAA